jgi:hypothetical protein
LKRWRIEKLLLYEQFADEAFMRRLKVEEIREKVSGERGVDG